jgi:hypothetical protein
MERTRLDRRDPATLVDALPHCAHHLERVHEEHLGNIYIDQRLACLPILPCDQRFVLSKLIPSGSTLLITVQSAGPQGIRTTSAPAVCPQLYTTVSYLFRALYDQHRPVSNCLLLVFVQVGGITASQIYQAKDSPLYKTGNHILLYINILSLFLFIFAKVFYVLKNKSRDKKWNALTKEVCPKFRDPFPSRY